MPRLSEFYGIVIAMYYNDHAPPHFHARYAEHEVTLSVDTLEVMNGYVPRRVLGLVLEWAVLHRAELRERWGAARAGEALVPIPGLD